MNDNHFNHRPKGATAAHPVTRCRVYGPADFALIEPNDAGGEYDIAAPLTYRELDRLRALEAARDELRELLAGLRARVDGFPGKGL